MNFKTLNLTQGIRIVEFNINHITKNYVDWLNDKEVVKFSEQRHKLHSLETCLDYYNSQKLTDNLFLAIEFVQKNSVEHLGNIIVYIDKYNQTADVSIMIGNKQFWGKGYGFIAWDGILTYLKDSPQIRLITAGTMELNIPMLSLMRRSGMKIDAVIKNRFLFDSQCVGLVLASLTK